MVSTEQAAKFLVLAWCKEWKLGTYLDAVMERAVQHDLSNELMDQIQGQFPWMPRAYRMYGRSVREFIGATYPKLSEWLWARADDAARMRCSAQIERLKCPATHQGFVSRDDRREMKSSNKAMRDSTTSYRLSRDAFKTNQRSAWNVCKG